MLRFLPYVIAVGLVLYALIDAALTPSNQARTLPKWLWVVLIVLVPIFGAIAWLLLGRPPRTSHGTDGGGGGGGGTPGQPGPRIPGLPGRSHPVAPDDDPDFLRKLDEATWSERMRRRREGGTPAE